MQGLKSTAMRAGALLREVLYPPECAGCREPTASAHGLCPGCWADTPFITGAVCRCCGLPLATPAPGEEPLCDTCLTRPPAWDRARAAVLYEGRARDILLRFKHRDRADLAPVLGHWLHRAAAPLLARSTLVAPVPLHWTRQLARRRNQAAELCATLRTPVTPPVVNNLLTRNRRTRSLKGLKPGERRAELSRAIVATAAHRHRLPGARVLLVDDVMTSGATLGACAEALRAAGAHEVNALVVARVAPTDFASI